jgi:hypothetical protein
LRKAIQLIKRESSHRIHAARGHKMQIWMVGFHDWTIRDESDWRAKAQYIWMNPVRARLVERPEDWQWGSAAGKLVLDAMPEKYLRMASGAKAPREYGAVTRGLKPPPPKETTSIRALKLSPPKVTTLMSALTSPPLKETAPIGVLKRSCLEEELKSLPPKENAMRRSE